MRRLFIMLGALLLLLSGCGINENAENQAAGQNLNTLSATNQTSAANVSISNTGQTGDPEMTGSVSEFHPIIIKLPLAGDAVLLGGFKQKWLSAEDVSAFIEGREEYQLFSLTECFGVGIGDTVIPGNSHEPYTIDIKSSLSENEGFLGISCDWDPMPRNPVQQSNSCQTYENIVFELLEKNGLRDVPINIVQNYRIDLDGDGQDEVLLYAQNIEPINATFKKNTYSVLLLRKFINNKVENIFLQKDIYLKDGVFTDEHPEVLNIEAIADLNGNGVMDVIVSFQYYEGSGYRLYELRENQVEDVLSTAISFIVPSSPSLPPA